MPRPKQEDISSLSTYNFRAFMSKTGQPYTPSMARHENEAERAMRGCGRLLTLRGKVLTVNTNALDLRDQNFLGSLKREMANIFTGTLSQASRLSSAIGTLILSMMSRVKIRTCTSNSRNFELKATVHDSQRASVDDEKANGHSGSKLRDVLFGNCISITSNLGTQWKLLFCECYTLSLLGPSSCERRLGRMYFSA
jgi:hypothetical protein